MRTLQRWWGMAILSSTRKRSDEKDEAERRIYDACSLTRQNGITPEQALYLLKRSAAQGAAG
ncbi:hypothetical protein GCM10022276_22500 [Sphingomonas limnosediminicola]|uniref:ANTAR domain-containing protein n=1 Tax=Sphingomonas limnosediminicola TaxID=940133 RepID=A0ABP7LP38_9SPHN